MAAIYCLKVIHYSEPVKTAFEFTSPAPFDQFPKGERVEFLVDGKSFFGVVTSRSCTLEVQKGKLVGHVQKLTVERVGPI